MAKRNIHDDYYNRRHEKHLKEVDLMIKVRSITAAVAILILITYNIMKL